MSNLVHQRRVVQLYKTILRLHRALPLELGSLGTSYMRDEFRRHKTADPATAVVFLHEWADYAVNLAQQLGARGPKTESKLGKNVDERFLDRLTDEQIAQLYELRKSTTHTESK